MVNRTARVIGAVATAAALGFTLGACASAAPAPEPAPSSSLVGGDPATWTPVFLDEANAGTDLAVVVGQAGVIQVPDASMVFIDNPKVLASAPASAQDSASSNYGFTAVAAGKAMVRVIADSGDYTWTVTVTDSAPDKVYINEDDNSIDIEGNLSGDESVELGDITTGDIN